MHPWTGILPRTARNLVPQHDGLPEAAPADGRGTALLSRHPEPACLLREALGAVSGVGASRSPVLLRGVLVMEAAPLPPPSAKCPDVLLQLCVGRGLTRPRHTHPADDTAPRRAVVVTVHLLACLFA